MRPSLGVLVGAALTFSLVLLTNPASAQQMIPTGGPSGTSCPSGTSYAGAGYCRAARNVKGVYIPAKGGTTCPSGSQ